MLLHFYALGLILLAALPAALMAKNLPHFRRLPRVGEDELSSVPAQSPRISVLIPARDEQSSIGGCLESVLACRSLTSSEMEVIVMDDDSSDDTRAICEQMAANDARLSVRSGGGLPAGWNGKQHACWQLALAARGQWLLFIDADVRLSSDAIPRLLAAASQAEVDLLSGFPRQITGTFFERLLIPLMHFVLLGYLPLERMRASPGAEFAAGCGQLFLARQTAYAACEGHKAIAASRHDGLKLPRSFRRQGLKTDVFDASDIASCRMYHSGREVFRGLLKNATEGIANPRTIVPFTVLLAGAAVLPPVSLVLAIVRGWSPWVITELAVACCLSWAPRWLAMRRFDQSRLSAVLHPLGVAIFLAIQWLALLFQICGVKTRWRGRL
ncbi:MAG: glycosyltransferase family 2 protein [Aureliella sp.]